MVISTKTTSASRRNNPSQGEHPVRILVWDWPVRVFHWLLVLAFAAAWLTAGDDRYVDLHAFFGYAALLLALFRIAWGFVGTRHARFREFAVSPAAALAYARELLARRTPRHYLTHNPVGSWAVWFLLALVFALAVSGVITLGGEEQQGPLAGLLERPAGKIMREVHEVIAWAGVALIALHIAGVIAESRVHHENLVRAMLDGRKDGDPAAAIPSARGVVALALCVVLAVFAAWYFRIYAQATPEQPAVPYTSPALSLDAQWKSECGSCHLAYHPSLLPARSWQALFARQADHFGEDLALDAGVVAALSGYAQAHAAEQGASEAAIKIAAELPAGSTPLRITDTPYWRRKHAEVEATVWKSAPVHGKGDCAACHRDAEAATFEDAAMHIPR